MKALLFLACIAGCVIQYWRWLAGEGFGAGRLNAPLIFATEGLYFLAFALGFTLKWGSAALLGWWFGWPLAIAALLVGLGASRAVVRGLCWRDIEGAAEFNRELAARKAGRSKP